jgi:hypothetical protein
MIDRANPDVATCDSETGCNATITNDDNVSLVEFQQEIAQRQWFWHVDYSYCPQHAAEARPYE